MNLKKWAIVTGANSGIGLETAKGLADAGFNLILASRNVEKTEQVRTEICRHNKIALNIYALDLGSLQSIKSFAEKMLQNKVVPELLVNNAGCFSLKFTKTKNDFELTFGVNFVGTAFLTMQLLPLLKETKAKIIFTSSDAYKYAKLNIQNLDELMKKQKSFPAYALSKLALNYFVRWLADKLKGITVNAVHPGHVHTGIWGSLELNSLWSRFIDGFMRKIALTSEQGAKPVLYTALANELAVITGKYIVKQNFIPWYKNCQNKAAGDQLMQWTKAELAKRGFQFLPDTLTNELFI